MNATRHARTRHPRTSCATLATAGRLAPTSARNRNLAAPATEARSAATHVRIGRIPVPRTRADDIPLSPRSVDWATLGCARAPANGAYTPSFSHHSSGLHSVASPLTEHGVDANPEAHTSSPDDAAPLEDPRRSSRLPPRFPTHPTSSSLPAAGLQPSRHRSRTHPVPGACRRGAAAPAPFCSSEGRAAGDSVRGRLSVYRCPSGGIKLITQGHVDGT
jgi:hypothetical protein